MALKKKSAPGSTDSGSNKKKRKEEMLDEVEIPVAKKSRKKEQPKMEIPSSDEEDLHEDLQDDQELDKDAGDVLDWQKKDMMELFRRIEAQIPEDDTKSFATRASRLEWDEIAFNNYNPNECKQVWEKVTKKIRRFRLLKEMLVDARQWVTKPWTNFYSGSKTQNHPDMPRRPLSQYMLYYMEKKDKVSAQNPNLQMPDVSKLIAEMYKGLSQSKKLKYVKKATQLREEYNEKMREFVEKHPDMREEKSSKRNSKNSAASKDTVVGCPKPRLPRVIFIEEYLKKQENSPSFDKESATQEARNVWQGINDKKRLFYINLALEEEKKYQEAVKQYCEDNPGYQPPPFKTVLKKEEILLRDRAAGKPSKPPTSGYSLFSRIMLGECPELKEIRPSNRMQEISTRWHSMSDAEKNEYAKRVKYDQERYKLDYATYLESLTEEEKQEELMKTQARFRPKPSLAPVAESSDKSSSKAKVDLPKTNLSTRKGSSPIGSERLYFPGEPRQPPVKAYDLFVKSFKNDTKLSESEAPRFWDMLPPSDKAKFDRKLNELKDHYIRDYEKFLKSLDQDELSKYNDLQKKNQAMAEKKQNGGSDDDDDDMDSTDGEEQMDSNDVDNDQEDSDSDEDENKKSDSSSDGESSSSSSSNSSSSSSSEDSDSSSEDSDDEDAKSKNIKKEQSSDSDSSD